jgi:hypothetical protein
MIDLDKINERKQVIAKDIEAVRARMAEAQKKFAEDQALLHALMGAFQQCDAFAKELDNDETVRLVMWRIVKTPRMKIGGTD